MHVAVLGGTGLVGSRLVNRLRDHGVQVAVGSYRTGVNSYNGQGLSELFDGADVVVDATSMNRPAYDYEQAHQFFKTCTRNVLRAELSAGVRHHVGVSIIGANLIDSEFFRGKATLEELVGATPTPHSILRSTVFFEHLPKLVEHASTTHFVRLPPVKVQPVAADEVAAELVRIALGTPREGVYEVAGPEVHLLDELGQQVLTATGDQRPVMTDQSALYMGARLDSGTEALLPSWRETNSTFTEWLERHESPTAHTPT
jgi:uncharacterized protein YbjT (DUF2867 family)